jgi:hypothetical protein
VVVVVVAAVVVVVAPSIRAGPSHWGPRCWHCVTSGAGCRMAGRWVGFDNPQSPTLPRGLCRFRRPGGVAW